MARYTLHLGGLMVSEDARKFRISVRLSIQTALLENVVAALRGVTIRPEFPMIYSRFIYQEVDEQAEELMQLTATYVIADFNQPVDIDFEAVAVPPELPRDLLPGEEWVYLRYEP